MRTLLVAALLASCATAPVRSVVDDAVAAPIADRRFMGVVLVARDGHPIFEKAYGLADVERNVANTPQTQFMIMSVSKQFTAAVIMRLVAAKQLRLDDRVSGYLDDWPTEWSGVDVRHLLSHSSGLPIDDTYFWLVKRRPEYWADSSSQPPRYEPQPLLAEPGTKYQYANVGYTLLTIIASKAGGRPFKDLLRDEVLLPLQLTHTTIERESRVPDRARGYDRSISGFALHEQRTVDIAGAGDIVSTAEDLARFDAAFDDDRFLPRHLRDAMFTPRVEAPRGASIGYGWFLRTTPKGRALQYHTGDGAGFRAFNYRLPHEHLEVVILSNVHESEMPWISPLLDRLADLR